jgi:hypothetical protein
VKVLSQIEKPLMTSDSPQHSRFKSRANYLIDMLIAVRGVCIEPGR